MKRFALCLVPSLFALPAHAAVLDCAALAMSALPEPAGYRAQCMPQGPNLSPLAPERGVIGPGGLGYTYDMRGDVGRPPATLYEFTLPEFDEQSPIGETQGSIFAMDFDPAGEVLYAATGATATTNPSTLGRLDTETGAFTPIAILAGLAGGDSVSGITIDPLSGSAYLSAAGGSPISSRLYTLDLDTGELELIGPITAPTDGTGTIFIDIAMNCQGELYGHNISDDALYTIDPETGAGTLIGTHGLAANFAQGMDFDNSDGTLYGFIYTGGGTNRFGSFDLETGAFTTLVQDNPLGEFEGAFPAACPAEGVLFADGFEGEDVPEGS